MNRKKFREAVVFIIEGFKYNYTVKPFKIRVSSNLKEREIAIHGAWCNEDRILNVEYDEKLTFDKLFYILLHEFTHIVLDEETDYYENNTDMIEDLPINSEEKDILFDELIHDNKFYEAYKYLNNNLKSRFD